ncbi:MAG: class I SAM-dependent methyltransferase [Candidatus Omnitrophica bacterium]|nr:class I SAM-dependent methyltransferase [Candidatus Omnitrophota bacterium]
MAVDSTFKKKWEQNLYRQEDDFWRKWFQTKGLEWHAEYTMRLDPNSRLQDIFLKYIDTSLPKNKIIDVGSGPLTIINKKCPLTELEIHAVDPFADGYRKLLDEFNIASHPAVIVQQIEGERLTEKFDCDSFDIAYSRNALDHAYDPLQCIREMIQVTKKGRYIIIQVAPKEGSRNRWHGGHKWDFFLKKRGLFSQETCLFLKGKRTAKVNVTDIFKNVTDRVELSLGEPHITAVFRKL